MDLKSHKHLGEYKALAKRYELHFVFHAQMPQYNWRSTGRIHVGRMDDPDTLAHEIAHYIVATPGERKALEFGLGGSPCAIARAPRTTRRGMYFVERLASLLGVFIQRHIEGRKEATATFDTHNWVYGEALPYVRTLIRQKHLLRVNGVLVPRCLVRPPRKNEIYSGKRKTLGKDSE